MTNKNNLENIVNSNQSTFKTAFNDIKNFAKGAARIGVIAALPLLYSNVPVPGNGESLARSAAISTYSNTVGRSMVNVLADKPLTDRILKEAAIGTAMTFPVAQAYHGLNGLENVVARSYGSTAGTIAKIGAQATVTRPILNAIGTGLRHGKNFKKYYWETFWKSTVYMGIPSAFNVAFMYQFGIPAQFLFGSVLNIAYSFLVTSIGEKINKQHILKALNPMTYLSAAASSTYKAFKGLMHIGTLGIYNPYKMQPAYNYSPS